MWSDDKLKLIEAVLESTWEYVPQRKENIAECYEIAGYYRGVLTCIDSILRQKGDDEVK